MRIAVIGAGLTGLLLARTLQDAGWQVTVFDKARAVGGRITTRSTSLGLLDIGAQYFTARDPEFQQLVDAWNSEGVIAPWHFTPYRAEQGALQATEDETLRYAGVGGMSTLARHLSGGLHIKQSTRVCELVRESAGWIIHFSNAPASDEFDWVALTLPVEQVRDLLGSQWSESLNLPTAVHLPCWAVGLATVGNVDDEIQGIFGDERIAWVSRQSAKPGFDPPAGAEDAWMLHFSPSASAALGRSPGQDLPGMATQWLAGHTGGALEFVDSYQHYWAYAGLRNHRECPGNRLDAHRQLVVAGAWCCGGRIEGAFQSARQVARQLL